MSHKTHCKLLIAPQYEYIYFAFPLFLCRLLVLFCPARITFGVCVCVPFFSFVRSFRLLLLSFFYIFFWRKEGVHSLLEYIVNNMYN